MTPSAILLDFDWAVLFLCSKSMPFMNEKKTINREMQHCNGAVHTSLALELAFPAGGYKLVPHLESILAVLATTHSGSFISLLNDLVSLGYKHNDILFSLTNGPATPY